MFPPPAPSPAWPLAFASACLLVATVERAAARQPPAPPFGEFAPLDEVPPEPPDEMPGKPTGAVLPAGFEFEDADATDAAPTDPVRMTGFLSTIDEVDLAAERPGVLRTLSVREGTRVVRDQVVGELADEVVRAKLATARLQAADDISERYALRAAEVSKADWQRMVAANERVAGVVVAADVERARLSYEQAKAQIEKSRQERELAASQVKELEADLQSYLIAAPFDGVVQRVHRRAGSAVQQGAPVVRLINTDTLRVEAFVPFAATLRLDVGDRAEGQAIVPGSSEETLSALNFEGRVTFIDQAEAQRTNNPTVRVFVEVDNADGRFRAGMQANVTAFPDTAPGDDELNDAAAPTAALPSVPGRVEQAGGSSPAEPAPGGATGDATGAATEEEPPVVDLDLESR